MPCSPSSPICGQRWRGNSSVSSISAAIGAILSAAKRWVVSRIVSPFFPGPKSRPVSDIIGLLFVGALAEREAFEQGGATAYVRCNNPTPEYIMATNASDPIVIPPYARTPMGSFQGALSGVSATELGATAVKAAVERAGISGDQVDKVFMGNVLPAGLGQAPARQAALGAGLPRSAEAVTVNKVCGSGMQAAIFAHDMLAAGSADVIVAGGMESMSNAPYLSKKYRSGARIGHDTVYDHMMLDGLEDAYEPGRAMGT